MGEGHPWEKGQSDYHSEITCFFPKMPTIWSGIPCYLTVCIVSVAIRAHFPLSNLFRQHVVGSGTVSTLMEIPSWLTCRDRCGLRSDTSSKVRSLGREVENGTGRGRACSQNQDPEAAGLCHLGLYMLPGCLGSKELSLLSDRPC